MHLARAVAVLPLADRPRSHHAGRLLGRGSGGNFPVRRQGCGMRQRLVASRLLAALLSSPLLEVESRREGQLE